MKRFHTMGWCILSFVAMIIGVLCVTRGLVVVMPWCGHILAVLVGALAVAGGIYVLHARACVRVFEPFVPDIHDRREETSVPDRRVNRRDRRKQHQRRALYNMIGKNPCKESNDDSGYEVLVS